MRLAAVHSHQRNPLAASNVMPAPRPPFHYRGPSHAQTWRGGRSRRALPRRSGHHRSRRPRQPAIQSAGPRWKNVHVSPRERGSVPHLGQRRHEHHYHHGYACVLSMTLTPSLARHATTARCLSHVLTCTRVVCVRGTQPAKEMLPTDAAARLARTARAVLAGAAGAAITEESRRAARRATRTATAKHALPDTR